VVCAGYACSPRSSSSFMAGRAPFVVVGAQRLGCAREGLLPRGMLRASTFGPPPTRRATFPGAAAPLATPRQPTPLGRGSGRTVPTAHDRRVQFVSAYEFLLSAL